MHRTSHSLIWGPCDSNGQGSSSLWEVPLAQPGSVTLRAQTQYPTLQWTTAASFLQTPKDPNKSGITASASFSVEAQRKGTCPLEVESSSTVTSHESRAQQNEAVLLGPRYWGCHACLRPAPTSHMWSPDGQKTREHYSHLVTL